MELGICEGLGAGFCAGKLGKRARIYIPSNIKVALINYVSRNQLHCTANLNFGLMCKKAKHCWGQKTFQFSSADPKQNVITTN